ncbi:hypothetical protein LIER_11539 [Lithospermum erythrorhizon]|uniref:Reverse transcriptase domain-containing protein n=1 Tax=Lithospermum erythrorhizon TaxID=34254 RepID=A0AAV3PPV0_LITER
MGRMRGFMPEVISLSQSPFIPGRSLTDSVMILQELVQGYHKQDGIPKMAIKVDLQKAYDMVEWESLWVVMETMQFPQSLKLNCAKSREFFGSLQCEEMVAICQTLHMEKGILPMKYLGIPLTSGQLTCEDFKGLTDKICSKISSWQARHLSFGGRAQLIRSSIFGV